MTVVTLARFVTWVAKLEDFLFLAELCWTVKTKNHSFNNSGLNWHKKRLPLDFFCDYYICSLELKSDVTYLA